MTVVADLTRAELLAGFLAWCLLVVPFVVYAALLVERFGIALIEAARQAVMAVQTIRGALPSRRLEHQ